VCACSQEAHISPMSSCCSGSFPMFCLYQHCPRAGFKTCNYQVLLWPIQNLQKNTPPYHLLHGERMFWEEDIVVEIEWLLLGHNSDRYNYSHPIMHRSNNYIRSVDFSHRTIQ
ncbi:hypothetical protein T310_6176, partial [Rasamsonia emersonii CBS 393.64]